MKWPLHHVQVEVQELGKGCKTLFHLWSDLMPVIWAFNDTSSTPELILHQLFCWMALTDLYIPLKFDQDYWSSVSTVLLWTKKKIENCDLEWKKNNKKMFKLMSCEGFIGPQFRYALIWNKLIKNSIRSFFCKQFCIELVLKVQIRCAAGSVPDGLQMTLKLEGNLTSQQKERLLQVSGTRLIQLVYYVAFTCIYFGHCFDVAQFYQKDGDEIKN